MEQWRWLRVWSEGGGQWGGEGLAASACLLLEYIYGVFIFHLQLRGAERETLQLDIKMDLRWIKIVAWFTYAD